MKGLPYLPYAGSKTQSQIVQFGGIRYGRGGSSGELSNSLNLSARQYPVLSQRMGRELVGSYDSPTAIFGKGHLCVVDGTDFLYNGAVKGTVTAGEKQMAAINTKIVIFPDKVYYDTASDKFGSLEAEVSAGGAVFTTDALTLTPAEGSLEDLFDVNQAVEISGCSISENNKEIIIRAVSGNKLTFYSDSFTAGNSTAQVTVRRRVPDLSLICAANNRIWGCDDTSIYACFLGDPLTWYNYDGLSTDAYAVAVGTDGPFTGCCAYGSNVLFFKENVLHKVIGLYPAEYQVYTYTVPGVQQGSHKSMQVINEVLYYKGVDGVYAYTGSTPYLLSANFGTRRYGSAAAGANGKLYYISMKENGPDGPWGLWVYDQDRGVWLQEDDTHVLSFASLDGDMLYLSEDHKVYRPESGDGAERIRWQAELYPMDETYQNRKGYSKLSMRYEMEPGAWMQVEVREDGGPYRQLCRVHGEGGTTRTVQMTPGRCDAFQIRLTGEGRCAVKSLVREFDMGSEIK